ncbi:MAG: hypothetical protein OXR66_05590 [Candidatus Woesearchaeota archaeon]|nr:hypothetical protein [Candidatus Woesearchaeota archaeon]
MAPMIGGAIIASGAMFFFSKFIALALLIAGFLLAFLYPYGKFSTKKRSIDASLHLFITYSGTISTMKISRQQLFKKIAEKGMFGEVSNVAEKILYLSRGWKLRFSESCRRMGARVPSQILADFFDRFAVMMDFGQDLEVFLAEEQIAVLNDYGTEYRKSLEVIRFLQDLFISLIVALSFILAIALLAPLVVDISVVLIVQGALLAFFVVDGIILFMIIGFVPPDKIFHGLKESNPAQEWIKRWFIIAVIIGAIAIPVLVWQTEWPFMVCIVVGILPLLLPGYLASREEKSVLRRDRLFPVYARTLGAAVEVRNGGVISALKSTQIHDFGLLNKMSIDLYSRLRLGSDKYKSWYRFAVDSGSHLIYHFSRIFSESIYMGGNAHKIGDIISGNVMKLLSLRTLRLQLAGGMRGAFYGSLIGLGSVMYVTVEISQQLVVLFSQPLEGTDAFSFVNSIVPQATDSADFARIVMFIGILLVAHAGASAAILKFIDGGSLYAALIDFVLMVGVCAAMSLVIPGMTEGLLPDFSGVWQAT